MSLLSRPKFSNDSCYQKITPKSANWDFVGFEAHEIDETGVLDWKDKDNESCLVILSGIANIFVEGEEF
ncbi:MAG: 5-deoxy-glucuronate isomerase, partial [Thiotrichales bacterium]|nr:5-deoxy-glucuronate isomerase [Thiotrichales bacterium]